MFISLHIYQVQIYFIQSQLSSFLLSEINFHVNYYWLIIGRVIFEGLNDDEIITT